MTSPVTVDLTDVYTTTLDSEIHHKPGNHLPVPPGVGTFAGTTFDVGGLIQLSGSISKEKTTLDFPSSVTDIPVHAIGTAVHFPHGSSWHDKAGTTVGEYRLHYADGLVTVIPIVYGGSVVDWWFMDGDALPTDAEVAWKGDNDRTRGLGHTIQVYAYTWANPRVDVEIVSMDFVSAGQESAPFLMAVTVD